MKIIKKYKNRRLYDTDLSQHITFEQLKSYIDDDIDFKVIESTTEKDITNPTLLQIIVEQEASNNPFLSKQILLNIIKLSKHPMHEMMTEFLESGFDMLSQSPVNKDIFNGYKQLSDQWVKQMQKGFETWQDWMTTSKEKNNNTKGNE